MSWRNWVSLIGILGAALAPAACRPAPPAQPTPKAAELPDPRYWPFIASRVRINEFRRAANQRSVSLTTPVGNPTETDALTLGDALADHASADSETLLLLHEELRAVPDDIMVLFVNCPRPLTNAEHGRICGFRRRNATRQGVE